MPESSLLLRSLAGPLAITLGYLVVYYLTMANVLRVKTSLHVEYRARGESFDRYALVDRRMLAADRIQLNTLEHMPAFLALLWLDAVLVSATHASILGGVYLLTRCVHPFAVGAELGRGAPRGILRITGFGYLALFLLATDLTVALARTLVG